MDYRANFAEDKAKFRSLACAKSKSRNFNEVIVKYAEKTRANSYLDRLLNYERMQTRQNIVCGESYINPFLTDVIPTA